MTTATTTNNALLVISNVSTPAHGSHREACLLNEKDTTQSTCMAWHGDRSAQSRSKVSITVIWHDNMPTRHSAHSLQTACKLHTHHSLLVRALKRIPLGPIGPVQAACPPLPDTQTLDSYRSHTHIFECNEWFSNLKCSS